MPPYATAQHIGARSHQCDAAAGRTHPRTGTLGLALLDGIGSTSAVQTFSQTMAPRLAHYGARIGDAETALRRLRALVAAQPGRTDSWDDLPCAAALLAVLTPDGSLTIAWSGDCRAYLLTSHGTADLLTRDHNYRRVLQSSGRAASPYDRNLITSCLGDPITEEDMLADTGHPSVETARHDDARGLRLILATDGAYEPLEDSCRSLAAYRAGTPRDAARDLVTDAIAHTTSDTPDNATALVADLLNHTTR